MVLGAFGAGMKTNEHNENMKTNARIIFLNIVVLQTPVTSGEPPV
jgi:hypothetical protein